MYIYESHMNVYDTCTHLYMHTYTLPSDFVTTDAILVHQFIVKRIGVVKQLLN